MKIVLASNNAGKLTEIKSLLSALDVDLVSQAELHVQEAEETGTTFVENALLKARHACVETGLPAIADDSGLQVTALGGEPGVYSARYSGGDSMDNINKLLENLRDLTGNARRASFHCAMVFLAHEHDPTPLICQGAWNLSLIHI